MAQPDDMFGDEDYPAYTMGRAAEIVGVSQDFLRRLGEAKLIDPFRSPGGHPAHCGPVAWSRRTRSWAGIGASCAEGGPTPTVPDGRRSTMLSPLWC